MRMRSGFFWVNADHFRSGGNPRSGEEVRLSGPAWKTSQPHTLRHSFAKNLVDAGTPLDQVATLLGHESLDTTRVYTRPSERDLEKAVRKAAGEMVDGPL